MQPARIALQHIIMAVHARARAFLAMWEWRWAMYEWWEGRWGGARYNNITNLNAN